MIVLSPARCAASTFSLMPPTGNTCPRRVISPVMARSARMRRPVSNDVKRGRHGHAGAGAILWLRARRHMQVDIALVEDSLVITQLLGVAAHIGQRRLRALLHHITQLTRELKALAHPACAMASMKMMSPPTGVHVIPVATPGFLCARLSRCKSAPCPATRANGRGSRAVGIATCLSCDRAYQLAANAANLALQIAHASSRACSRASTSRSHRR